MDLFEMFGIDPMTEEVATPKKAEKKSPAKKSKETKAPKAAQTKKEAKEETFELPVTIYTGYRNPLVIPEAGDGKKVTLSVLKAKLQERFPEYRTAYTILDVDEKKHSAWASFSSTREVAKGEIEVSAGDKLTLAGHDLDLSSVMTDETCRISLEAIGDALKNQHPSLYNAGIVKDGTQMAPVFHAPVLDKELNFPIRLSLYGRENWQITQEEYNEFVVNLGNDVEGNAVFDRKTLEAMVVERYPDFAGHLELQYLEDANIVVVTMKVKETAQSGNAKGKVKTGTMYPTEGTTLSFIFNHVELSPDLFDGKTEVNAKEMIAYCATMYPEFTEANTDLRYEKDKKLIIPVLRGSTKG